jgi:phosphoglycerate dehydrogenase-like enzyme
MTHRTWRGLVQEDKMTELTGSTVGLVGLGRIGREVAQRLKGWNVQLLYSDVFPAPDEVEQELGARHVSLTELLGDADIVSLHVPLCDETYHLIGERELRLMKPTAMLINTCRGPVVDQSALCEALQEGHLAGAGLDVFEAEPVEASNPLLDMQNVVVTPHVAGATLERIRRVNAFALENVKRVLRGDLPLSLVRAE